MNWYRHPNREVFSEDCEVKWLCKFGIEYFGNEIKWIYPDFNDYAGVVTYRYRTEVKNKEELIQHMYDEWKELMRYLDNNL